MHDVPPPEAFELQPEEAARGGGMRRRVQVLVTLIVVASLVVLAAVEGGGFISRGNDLEAPSATPASRLAVVDAVGALSTVDGQGRSVDSYAVPGVTFAFPAWSPDGSRIAAIGAGSDGTGVYVFAARATDAPGAATDPVIAYRSADRPPFYLYWTPDGQRVTFLTTEPDGLALRIAPADGGAAASVIRAGAPMYWDFVDPGRLLVHSGTGGTEGFFGEVAPDGTPFEGTDRSVGVFRAPVVSGDDRFRAYLGAGDGTVGEVVREARDGSGTARIRVFGTAAVAFSPTGDGLAFVAPDQVTNRPLPLPVGPLRILDPSAAEPRTLLGGSVVAFFWSPTGKVIAVLRLGGTDNNVTEASFVGDSAREVAAPGAAVREAVAGLELRLSFVGAFDGSVSPERILRVSDLFVNQVLPFFDQYTLSHRFWSPDGAALVLPIVGNGDVTQLVAIPVDGSEARVVATAEIGFWSP